MSGLGVARRFAPAIVAWLAVLAVSLGLPVAIRIVLVVATAAWVPGASVAWLLESKDRLERVVLVVALSLALTTIAAVALSIPRLMTGLRALAVIAALSSVVLALRDRRE